jgi:flavin reductase (DIM6/NTAB) family NADH-FMN oxidoreductase RutF
MPIEPATFRKALSHFPSGVTLLTVVTPEGAPHGMTASAFSSVSMVPPIILVCVKKGNSTHEYLTTRGAFAVNLLAEDQALVSDRFAGIGPVVQDRFADLAWRPAPLSGAPWLDRAITNLDCTLHGTADGGDHTVFLGEVVGVSTPGEERKPLIYWSRAYRSVGAKL